MPSRVVRSLLILALVVATRSAASCQTQEENQKAERSRTVKIFLRHARASDVVRAFGGGMISFIGEPLPDAGPPFPAWFGSGGQMAALLPDGTEAVVGFDVDNSVFVVGTAEAIRDMRAQIALVDVAPATITLHARPLITTTDRKGAKHLIALDADGQTSGDRRIHLRSDATSTAPGEPASTIADLDVAVRPVGDGSVAIDGDWYVDITWREKGGAMRKSHNVYRGDAFVPSGKTMTLARARIQTTGGTADVRLELTPRIPSGNSARGGAR